MPTHCPWLCIMMNFVCGIWSLFAVPIFSVQYSKKHYNLGTLLMQEFVREQGLPKKEWFAVLTLWYCHIFFSISSLLYCMHRS